MMLYIGLNNYARSNRYKFNYLSSSSPNMWDRFDTFDTRLVRFANKQCIMHDCNDCGMMKLYGNRMRCLFRKIVNATGYK